MKLKINKIYNTIEEATKDFTLSEFERLQAELYNLRQQIEDETCEDCGHRPATGACFYCKAD